MAVPLAALALLVTACGGGSGGGGGAGGSSSGSTSSATEGAKQAPVLAEATDARGTVTLCAGKGTPGDPRAATRAFDERFGPRGLRLRLRELPGTADEQRAALERLVRSRSGGCDVVAADVTLTAALAARGRLLDMSDYVNQRRDEFIASTLSTVRYDGRFWGVPQQADTALLYQRTDKVPEPPESWRAVYEQAGASGGIVYPGAAGEELTSAFLDVAYAAGGTVLSSDGLTSEIDSGRNADALQLMVDGIRDGAAPQAVTTYGQEQARRAFATGAPAFLRDGPGAHAALQRAPRVRDRFAIAPLPPFDGDGSGAGLLGGRDLVIPASSTNPTGALFVINHLTSPDVVREQAIRFSLAPVLRDSYDDRAVKRALPFAAELEQAVEQAKAPPVSPVYPQISRAISENVHAALLGRLSPEDALKRAGAQIERALESR